MYLINGDATGPCLELDEKLFDFANRYYESQDAFTGFGDKSVKRHVHWVTEG